MQHLYWKQIIASCLFISLSLSGFGQMGGVNQPDHDTEKFWSGLYFGIITNNYQYTRGSGFLPGAVLTGQTSKITSEPVPFLHGGIPVSFRLYKNVLFRTGTAIILNSDINNKYIKKGLGPQVFKTSPIFFQVPFALKYESDRYDVLQFRDAMRHYIFAGATLNYDFSTGSVYYGSSASPNTAILKPFNLTYDLGLGLTFVVNDYVRISPEIKFSYGFNNLIKPGVSGSPLFNLDKLTSNYVSFSLHIEN
jgi:hypothetical protein